MNVQSNNGVAVFTWDNWDIVDHDELQFYNAQFLFDTMKQYNGQPVTVNLEGKLTVYADDGSKLWCDFFVNIAGFKDKL